MKGFIAYPAEPNAIGQAVAGALDLPHSPKDPLDLEPWAELAVAGRFIATELREKISESDVFVADISVPNFNVAYEVGFAMGRRKSLLLIRSVAISPWQRRADFGIYDTIGWKNYENSTALAQVLREFVPARITDAAFQPLNRKAPVYLLQPKHKTDAAIRILSRVKKARLFYRSFDPSEQPRLSSFEAIQQVSQSAGVLVHLLPSVVDDYESHNLRAAFLAGLTDGLGRELLILQDGEEPVPLDYRDLVTPFLHPDQIDSAIAEFAAHVTERLQSDVASIFENRPSLLERLSLGASSAENELRDLGAYYLEIDAFQRARRGEIRLVVGRKGSGKTALFMQARDSLRRNQNNVVLDLKPEGYKLRKFKEDVLRLLEKGTLEHTITAFWEYLLLLEICHKLLEKDHIAHTRDSRLFEPYRRLAESYQADEFISEGDFSERLTLLLDRIRDDFQVDHEGSRRLSSGEITELLYRHDVHALKAAVGEYLRFKDSLWLLFDGIDKGWPTRGLEPGDLLVVRTLIEATRKIERLFQKSEFETHTLIFLRNDVYELLIDQTPDRGKEARVLLDWTDPDLLRELIRRRLVFNDLPREEAFDDLWRLICTSHVNGEESSQYLIDRCLMRPRALLDLLGQCRAFSVNLGHSRIEPEDIRKGVKAYSTDLLYEISLEIRDIFPKGEDVLYCFIDTGPRVEAAKVNELLNILDLNDHQKETAIDILLWYGVLGVMRKNGEPTFIYNVNYDMHLLRGIIRTLGQGNVAYYINPAFWSALEVPDNRD